MMNDQPDLLKGLSLGGAPRQQFEVNQVAIVNLLPSDDPTQKSGGLMIRAS